MIPIEADSLREILKKESSAKTTVIPGLLCTCPKLLPLKNDIISFTVWEIDFSKII